MKALLLEAKNAKVIIREEGFRALFQKYGWKLVIAIIGYYLVRDITLYIILPALIIKAL